MKVLNTRQTSSDRKCTFEERCKTWIRWRRGEQKNSARVWNFHLMMENGS